MVTKRELRERIAALELKCERERLTHQTALKELSQVFEQEKLKAEIDRKELSEKLDEILEAARTASKAPTAEEVLHEWFNGAERKR